MRDGFGWHNTNALCLENEEYRFHQYKNALVGKYIKINEFSLSITV